MFTKSSGSRAAKRKSWWGREDAIARKIHLNTCFRERYPKRDFLSKKNVGIMGLLKEGLQLLKLLRRERGPITSLLEKITGIQLLYASWASKSCALRLARVQYSVMLFDIYWSLSFPVVVTLYNILISICNILQKRYKRYNIGIDIYQAIHIQVRICIYVHTRNICSI